MANEQSCCVKLLPFTFFFSSFFFFICEFCKVPRCLRFHCLLLLFFPLHPKRQKKERKKVQLKLAGRFTHTHWRGFFFFCVFYPSCDVFPYPSFPCRSVSRYETMFWWLVDE